MQKIKDGGKEVPRPKGKVTPKQPAKPTDCPPAKGPGGKKKMY